MINLLNNLINNLGYLIFLAFIISNLSIFKNIIQKNEFQKFDLIILSITFAIFGIVGTYSGVDVNGAIANTRIIGIMAGGIFCGPFVGIVSGLIAGIHRLTYDIGGITSIPCALTTIIAGCFSGFIYKRCLKYEKWFYGLIGGIIIEIIEIFLILLLSKPYSKAFHIVENIYLPMIFINALGTCLLILLIQRIFNERDQIAATQAKIALDIATKTLPYFRDINNNSLKIICSIINNSTTAAAVAITDTNTILAHVGLGSDHHICTDNIQIIATEKVINDGIIRILNTGEEINCFCKSCPLKSIIIVPLKEDTKVIGTLKLYYEKENSISCTTKTLASGLSHLISTQLEISKLGKLKDLATKSEIKALQSQINPHFLFNSLNTIVSFMRFNPTGARALMINLSNYLRYNIDEIQTFVDISKELEHVKAYVEIEKARFGHKLNINYDIDRSVHIKIPSLIIQPLVENSIKHGILNGKGFGTVNIKVKKYNLDEVKVTIEDDGIGIPQNVIDIIYLGTIEKNKIGISNVNNRLKYIYGTGLIIERLHTGTRISFVLNKTKNFNFDII